MLRIIFLLLIFQSTKHVICGRILAIVPCASYSHQIVFQPLWRELSLRGHQVTLLTTDPINDPNLTNLTEINLHDTYDIVRSQNITQKIQEYGNNAFKMIDVFLESFRLTSEHILSKKEVQALIKNETEHFDLVMIEHILGALYPFARRFKAPFIGILSLEASSNSHKCMGNPTHPILYPNLLVPFSKDLNFFQRVVSTFSQIFTKWAINSFNKGNDFIIAKYFGEGYPPVQELTCEVDMLFTNVNPIFSNVRPLVPGVIQIGGIHIQEPKPLPKDIKDFLDSAEGGVVYFSLGSNVQAKNLPEREIKVILETFAELPYKFLWKFEGKDLPKLPENVKIGKWLPQPDILRHPNVKVFVTQGGAQSLDEALYSSVPMVGIPYFGDQPYNINKIVNKGLGVFVDHFTMDKETLKAAISEVMKNPKYRENVKKLGDLARDQPMTPLERAVWWTEYVLRHKGAKHLKGPAADIPFYQYILLDVIGFVLAIIFTSGFILWKSVKWIWAFVRKITSKAKCYNTISKPKLKKR